MDSPPVTPVDFAELDGVDDWRFVLYGIIAEYATGSYSAAAELVSVVADAAEAARHHPDVALRYPDRVRIVLTTHAAGGLTTADVDLARQISSLAAAAGATADPGAPQIVELAIDTTDADRIRPFWAAVLGYVAVDGNLVDPARIGPPMWFQSMDQPRTDRDRFHLDVSVPHDVAEERVAAALAAGGTLVTDRYAPSWWVLADADGNEACVCTWRPKARG
ncbi:MAG: 4a-hydroxytetrahydrobiopterin dehydratase [Acidimicrobiia bacterium]|nr:4a-hydroxytetrahydrobiopterin dehydratase [Acidimicrobiia bacterium]